MKKFSMTLDGITLQTGNARRAVKDESGDPRTPTTDPAEFKKAFAFAMWSQRSSAFWLGDMLLTGLDLFGDEIWQHLEYDISMFDHLERCRGVSAKVPPQNRNPNLSWSHHAYVASVPVQFQADALSHAAEEGLNSSEFQAWIASERRSGRWG